MTTSNTESPKQLLLVSTLEQQNAAVFGNVNEQLADALTDFVQSAIRDGVQSLPLLQDAEKSKTLIDTILKPYLKHIDLVELYGERNLFTLRHSAPRRRQRIVQCIQGGEKMIHNNAVPQEPIVPSTTTNTITYPKREEIPSSDDIQKIQEELAELAIQLKNATARRNTLIQASAALDTTLSFTTTAVQSVQDIQPSLEPITAAVMGGQGLQDLAKEGKRLQQELHSSNTEEGKNDNDDDDDPQPQVKKRVVLTLEESYHQERQAVNTTTENLVSLSKMLKQSKKKINNNHHQK